MATRKAETAPTFIVAGVVLFLIGFIHIFKVYPITVDKFTIYIVSVFTGVMLLPLVKHLKFFDIVELRREYRQFRKAMRR